MRGRTLIGISWLAAALAGCQSFFAPRGIPHDPLMLDKQPIESKGQVSPAEPLRHQEPRPPGGK